MTNMEIEIKSQPEVLAKCFAENEEKTALLASKITDNSCKHVILVARGSSDNACMFFKYLLESKVGKPVVFFHPSVITMYDSKYDFSGSVVIGVSQSGQAADCLAVMEEAKAQGAFVASITNFVDSPMATNADLHLHMNVGLEKSVAATKTMTGEMLLLAEVVAKATNEKLTASDYEKGANFVIENENAAKDIAEELAPTDQIIVLSRGNSLSAAYEIALKLQETCYINARPYAISDFYHGPFALASEKIPFILISTDENTKADSVAMVKKLKSVNARVYVITNDEELAKEATSAIMLPCVNEYTDSVSAVIAGQILALNLSAKRGLNPDSPRGLNKVTITK